jgi:hypothetical protein
MVVSAPVFLMQKTSSHSLLLLILLTELLINIDLVIFNKLINRLLTYSYKVLLYVAKEKMGWGIVDGSV